MFALVHSHPQYGESIREQMEGLFEYRQVSRMSELLALAPSIQGIWVDSALGITDRLRERFSVPVFEIAEDFCVSEVMRWWETVQRPMSQPDAKKEEEETRGVSGPALELPDAKRDDFFEGKRVIRGRVAPAWMFCSPKGGEGRSTMATHMAYFAAASGKRVVYLDFDPNGNAAMVLGLPGGADARNWRGETVEKAVRDGVAWAHESGLIIFPSAQGSDPSLLHEEDAWHLLRLAVSDADTVVVDMPQGWTPLHVSLLRYMRRVVAVVSPAPDRMDRVQDFVAKLLRANVGPDELAAIVNHPRGEADHKAMDEALHPYAGRVSVPYDRELARKGGANSRAVVRSCTAWWREELGIQSQSRGRRSFWNIW